MIDYHEVRELLRAKYDIHSEKIKQMPGEIDKNYKITTSKNDYLFKISSSDPRLDYLDFQVKILTHIERKSANINTPKIYPNKNGKYLSSFIDKQGNKNYLRLLSWCEGRTFSSVNPINEKLLYSLGEHTGQITKLLLDFDHDYAHRQFEWDNTNYKWIINYLNQFSDEQRSIIEFYIQKMNECDETYRSLRKSVVHNDVNDNNVIVTDDLLNPKVSSIIDYGDAIFTQTINDLAICIAYASMDKPNPLDAAKNVVSGYNRSFKLDEDELLCLYSLVGIRLCISVTKSAINKKREPNNKYLQISERPAWDLLYKWQAINPSIAYYTFRDACNIEPFPNSKLFSQFSKNKKLSIYDLLPAYSHKELKRIDMSIGSLFLGNKSELDNNELFSLKLKKLECDWPNTFFVGGYLERRPLYTTEAYKREGNNGSEQRCVHLGMDFWVSEGTKITSLFEGRVFSAFNNDKSKDYGPTIILEHQINNFKFYTLYGHLSKKSLNLFDVGKKVNKGDLIGFVGDSAENGDWAPHLHFQIILSMLDCKNDFPGVAYQSELNVWKSICPNPNLIFQISDLEQKNELNEKEILEKRNRHLGKSLSLSYYYPLHIVRGEGQYLIDKYCRKYLDTVNNVAHVGHEHQKVVEAAQKQIAVLNTNTRYLHENIINFAEKLLSTFPKELSVVHFVNSGSEANELALRMAKSYTNQKDVIAVEVGYHGNTSGCIDISSYKFDGTGGKGAPEYTHIVPLPDSFRGKYRGESTGAKYAAHINEKLDIIKSKGRGIAGFICESILSCGGQIKLPESYLKHAYKAIRDKGGVCIADEVQVGLGRVGSKFWGFELYNVIPDIVTIGKPLGNGHPLAAVVCTNEIADAFNNGMEYFNTFGGNPVSCIIGLTVLDVIQEENLQQNAYEVGEYLKKKLFSLQNEFPIIGDVRGEGLFLGFELVDNKLNPETEKANYLVNRMRELGVLMSTDGKDNNVIKIKPPIIFTKENCDEVVAGLSKVFNEDFMRK